jgi:hypothetical protein
LETSGAASVATAQRRAVSLDTTGVGMSGKGVVMTIRGQGGLSPPIRLIGLKNRDPIRIFDGKKLEGKPQIFQKRSKLGG